MSLKHELQILISGTGKETEGNLIQTAAHYLRKSKEAGGTAQANEFTKEQEAERLIDWIYQNNYWHSTIPENRFIARGAEQKVYLDEDTRYVLKLNDSVFYAFWLDYFYSLLLHNFFFPATEYCLKGFYKEDDILFAVVQQPFIEITEPTDLEKIRLFLVENNFQLKRNNDYYNPELGLILEDLHDENVLTNKGTLFFIDTVFYLTPAFYS
jgi:hypothetical protein